MIKRSTFLIFLFSALTCSFAHAETLVPFFRKIDEQILWGYVNRSGEERINPSFQRCDVFREGLAPVMIGQLWGYIDASGNIVVQPIYSDAGLFSEGRAYVRSAPKKEEQRYPFAAGRQLYAYIDPKGNVITEFVFERATQFSEGLAYVEMETTGGYITRSGKLEIESNVLGGPFQNGLAPVYGLIVYTPTKRRIVGDSEKCFITTDGVRTLQNAYTSVDAFHKGKALVSKVVTNESDKVIVKYAFIDVRGRVLAGWSEKPKLSELYEGAPASFVVIDAATCEIPLGEDAPQAALWQRLLDMCRDEFGSQMSTMPPAASSLRTEKIYNTTGVYRSDYRVGLYIWIKDRTLWLRAEAQYIDEKGLVRDGGDSDTCKVFERRVRSILHDLKRDSGSM